MVLSGEEEERGRETFRHEMNKCNKKTRGKIKKFLYVIYIYIYVYVHIYTYIYIHTHMYTYVYVHTHIYTYFMTCRI